jgi:hypothetical protein
MSELDSQRKNLFPIIFYNELKKMLRQVRIGAILRGRVADCLGANRYVLEIRGAYILSESQYAFRRGEEAWLIVRAIDPDFILEMVKENYFERLIAEPGHTNLLVL